MKPFRYLMFLLAIAIPATALAASASSDDCCANGGSACCHAGCPLCNHAR